MAEASKWTPLAVSDRRLSFGTVREAALLLFLLVFGGVATWGFFSVGFSLIGYVFVSVWMLSLLGVAARKVGRWWSAAKFRFYEEGLAVCGRGETTFHPWSTVTAAEIESGADRWGEGAVFGRWHVLTLVFADGETVRIPLTPFAKERSLSDAIVARIPAAVEQPQIPLEDE